MSKTNYKNFETVRKLHMASHDGERYAYDKGRPLYYSNCATDKQLKYIKALEERLTEIDPDHELERLPTNKEQASNRISALHTKIKKAKAKKNKDDFLRFMMNKEQEHE